MFPARTGRGSLPHLQLQADGNLRAPDIFDAPQADAEPASRCAGVIACGCDALTAIAFLPSSASSFSHPAAADVGQRSQVARATRLYPPLGARTSLFTAAK